MPRALPNVFSQKRDLALNSWEIRPLKGVTHPLRAEAKIAFLGFLDDAVFLF